MSTSIRTHTEKIDDAVRAIERDGYERGVRDAIHHFDRLLAWVYSDSSVKDLVDWGKIEAGVVEGRFPFLRATREGL